MRNNVDQWRFFKRSRMLSEKDVAYWRRVLEKLLKTGIELEYNLPDKNGLCRRDNQLCPCVATFKPKLPQAGTTMCYEQCRRWDDSIDENGVPKYAKDGNCPIAREHGCAGIYCSAFQSPCPTCTKYDRGCNNCADVYNPTRDARNIRAAIEKELRPTNFVGEYGPSGVYKVTTDGSLLPDGGIEIATVGRRPQFYTLYESMKRIMGLCQQYGAYTNERCSIHIHLLASHLTAGFNKDDRGGEFVRGEITELEKPVPEIILANFHQLIRKFHCALIWLGVAGTDMKHLTRWEKFRKPILDFSALRMGMPSVVEAVTGMKMSKPKYALMNYAYLKFDEQGNIPRLHVEARYLDGMFSPSVVAAHAILIYALMLKAVEMSRFGILESGDREYMTRQREILKHLCNNDGGYDGNRHSDTRLLEPYIPMLQEQSLQLIRLVKNVLNDEAPADRILRALARKPVALRLIEGQSWEQIEADLGPEEDEKPGPFHQLLTQIIDTASVNECQTVEEWAEEVTRSIAQEQGLGSQKLATVKHEIETYIDRELASGRLFWSKELGSYATKG